MQIIETQVGRDAKDAPHRRSDVRELKSEINGATHVDAA